MKSVSAIILILIIEMVGYQYLSAQKVIKIDAQLKTRSQPMIVKRKGTGVIGKYEFGPYKIISGKTGLEKSSSKSQLFGGNTTTNSSSHKSFVFINDEADTAIVNIRTIQNIETDDGNWLSRTFLNWEYTEVKKGEGIFEADLAFSMDTTTWQLVIVFPLVVEQQDRYLTMDNTTHFKGMMTDKNTTIEIKYVTKSEDGKNSILNPVLGYEFWRGDESLAAMQVVPGNRMYVWIRNDLDAQLKFVLASAAATLLVKTF